VTTANPVEIRAAGGTAGLIARRSGWDASLVWLRIQVTPSEGILKMD
jgi:hypothetical protein